MARRLSDSLIFDTLRLEGGLFVPAVLEKAARGEHTAQKAADYRLPKGLALVDEQGRAFRIATALYKTFEPTHARKDVDAARATITFVTELLRDAFGYADFALRPEPVTLADRAYPITAFASGGRVPVIIAPHTLELDEPDELFAVLGSGSRRRSAYQLAQQFLNASVSCTWAILTNGRQLRLVRDADTLTRPAFLEADLDLILRAQRYPDFAAVWRLFHTSRAGSPEVPGATYPWEAWKKEGQEQGERVREGLRTGVTEALLALGTGFIERPSNEALRLRLQTGDLAVADYLQQLFRLIYRFLFLFTVEERGLLHVPDESLEARRAREAYTQGYAFRRLRDRALRRSGFDRYSDVWTSVQIVFAGLAGGEARLALPALGGLFATTQCPDIDGASLDNRFLLTAMRHLRWSASSGQLAAIDYRNMDSEELGSVYESLLELVPTVDLATRRFGFVGLTDAGSTAGNARKTSGSYYTPDSLVQELIKSALDPVIAQKVADHPANPVEALLSLSVCDPSCGSGHFLLAAARRLAEKLAELRAVDGAVTPADYRHSLREVASHCLYGVDINPMAVELCRVALWLETIDPGKPLGFLNHHIRTGNSLLGTTPDLIAAGLPDDTFTAIEGDDKAACSELKKRNKNEREGFGPLFQQEEQSIRDLLRLAATQIEAMDDNQPTALLQKEAAFATSETAPEYRHAKLLADLWCAAFVIKKHYPGASAEAPVSTPPAQVAPVERLLLHSQDELFGQPTPSPTPRATSKKQSKPKNPEHGTPTGITTAHLRDFVQGKPLPAVLQTEVEALARQYRFFHWHLAFPQVFEKSGFDCILGNPPWEKINLKDEEFFAEANPQIANATNKAERKRLIDELKTDAPLLYASYAVEKDMHDRISAYFRFSGYFPFTGVSRINLYSVFCEIGISLLKPNGRLGMVLASGIVTDDNNKELFSSLITRSRLVHAWDFVNSQGIFPGVHRSFKFLLLCAGGLSIKAQCSDFAFYLETVEDLKTPERHFTLSSEELHLLNPTTETCPAFRNQAEAEINKYIYRRIKAWSLHTQKSGWPGTPKTPFNMSNDSGLFVDKSRIESNPSTSYLPLYESKFIHQFNHRFATFGGDAVDSVSEISVTELHNPSLRIESRYWLEAGRLAERFQGAWFLAWRDITCATNERTSIAAILPNYPCAHTMSLIESLEAQNALLLCGTLNSFPYDYCARQKVSGTHLNHGIWKQLPLPHLDSFADACRWSPDEKSLGDWLFSRVLELTYTAWDLEGFANDCGCNGPPFRWDGERRFLLRCELDAAFFHLYVGPEIEWQQQPKALTRAFPTPRQAVAYIMDTFPIVRRKDEANHSGIYRTKETILQIYDALQESIRSGQPYQTLLDPPPADPRCCHPPRESAIAPVRTSPPVTNTSIVPPRVPFTAENISHYLQFLVYAWIQKANGNADLRTVVRAFTLLREPQRITSQLKGNDQRVVAWRKSFREPVQGATLRPILDVLRDRKAVRVIEAKGGVLTLAFPSGSAPVTIPAGIELDAEFSLRAAQQELAGEKPLIEVEQSEYNHFLAHVS